MQSIVPKIVIDHLLDYLVSHYESYGPVFDGEKTTFQKIESSSEIKLFSQLTISSFKSALFGNLINVEKLSPSRKIALIGLSNCDIWALDYFLDQFKNTDLLPERKNIIVVGCECKPTKSCFCYVLGTNRPADFDFFLQKEKENRISVFTKGEKAGKIFKTLGLENKNAKLREITLDEEQGSLWEIKKLSKIIEKKDQLLWQSISNNCFACGACAVACPLCFCFHQSFDTDIDGNTHQSIKWDSCFNKDFAEIQHRFDLRPKNVDRYYNWYHHKFVRSYFKNKYPLCTGCGRCIDACPANLNIKNILIALQKKDEGEKK